MVQDIGMEKTGTRVVVEKIGAVLHYHKAWMLYPALLEGKLSNILVHCCYGVCRY
jgi:hypothetical protein